MSSASTGPSTTAQDASLQHDRSLDGDEYRVGFRADLLTDLSKISTAGSFAAFERLPQVPPVGLHVPDIGDIRMPLDETQAQQLIAKARQAPFGKSTETLVDKSVRNTWELDADQFSFTNPAWDGFVQTLQHKVASAMGVHTAIRAELYKMLIYEKGSLFKAHTDTMKIPNMFGTLVVSLPSKHEGGEVVLKHCGETKTFQTSEAEQAFACWYSDVSHEVLPVKSGYRWVLTFNLAIDDVAAPRPSAGLQRAETQNLRNTLRRWISDCSTQPPSAYPVAIHALDHDYTEASVSFGSLKGRDLAQVQTLKELSNELPFDIFLALVEKKEVRDVEFLNWSSRYGHDEEDDEEDEEDDEDDEDDGDDRDKDDADNGRGDLVDKDVLLNLLVDLEGRQMVRNMDIEEMWVLDKDALDEACAEEEHSGYTGNEGETETHWYRLTAAVLVPRNSTLRFLLHKRKSLGSDRGYQNPKATQSLIRYTAKRCMEKDDSGFTADVLKDLCTDTWNSRSERAHMYDDRPLIDSQTMFEATKAAILTEHPEAFECLARLHQGGLPTQFFVYASLWLGISPEEKKEAQPRFSTIQKGLSIAIHQYKSLKKQLYAVQALAPLSAGGQHAANGPPAFLLAWARETLTSCVQARVAQNLTSDDGQGMVELALYFEDPVEFLSNIASPIVVDQQRKAPAFCLRFLSLLIQQTIEENLPKETAVPLVNMLLESVLSRVEFNSLHTEKEEARRPFYFGAPPSPAHPSGTITTPDSLVGFASAMLDMKSEESDPLARMVTKIAKEGHVLPIDEYFSLWLPFLESFASLAASKSVELSAAYIQDMYTSVLHACLNKFVGREHPKDTNMSRSPVGCTCRDCQSLNSFLADGRRRVERYSMGKPRRRHLEDELGLGKVDCTCVTETGRKGMPLVLVVTKTFKQNEAERQKWRDRKQKVKEFLGRFKQADLKLLLGDEFQSITEMKHLSLTASSSSIGRAQEAPPGVLSPRAANQLAPMAGQKRKRPAGVNDVIDLTTE